MSRVAATRATVVRPLGIGLAALLPWLWPFSPHAHAQPAAGTAASADLPSLELLEYLASMAERDGELLGPESLAGEAYAILDERTDVRAETDKAKGEENDVR
ncbi:MAG: hypothetical protein AAF515_05840 [Pseudomonadota bacterium]